MQPRVVAIPGVARKGLGPVGGAAAGLISSISGRGSSGLGCFGPKSEEVGEGESAIQQPEGLEGSRRFGCILDKHGLWLAAGIFLRIRGGVDRPRKKTKLIKCAAPLGVGPGWYGAGCYRHGHGAPRAPGPAQPQG